MKLAIDTYYFEDKAKTILLGFNDWKSQEPEFIREETIEGIAAYEPGAFYKRELPCILSILKTVDLKDIEAIIIDGFVVLDDFGKIGLGGHLFEKLNRLVPVIGVAKSGFHDNKKYVRALYRGESKKPLFITSKGMELDEAFEIIQGMHGAFRMPTLLQIMDTKTKE